MKMILCILPVFLTLSGDLFADTVKLRREAGSAGPQVRLLDVAELEGEEAGRLGPVVVGEFTGSEKEILLTLDSVRKAMEVQSVNWGKVSLRGPLQIRVTHFVKAPAPAPVAAEMIESGQAFANPMQPVSISGAVASAQWALPAQANVETVGDRIRRWIVSQLGADGADVGIEFQDNSVLSEPAGEGRLELEPLSRSFLGRLPVQVRRYAADGRMKSDSVLANVRRRMQAVVATRSLGRGSVLAAEDVQLREIWLNAATVEAVSNLDQAIGRKLRGTVTTGSLISVGDLEEALSIKRGQMVTVRCLSGGLVMRMTARAMESGEVGQWIQVKNEQNRQLFQARVSGPQEAVIVVDALAADDGEVTR